MNNVTVNRGQGGLGRAPLGQDFVSGLLFYGTAPAKFTAAEIVAGVCKFGGIQDALNAGIVPTGPGNYSDETPAILETACATGNTGDIVYIYSTEPGGVKVLIASYQQTAGDANDTDLAADIAIAINANTVNNGGYTATSTAGNLFITARPGLGIWFNTNYATLITFSYSAGATLALGTASKHQAGVASVYTTWYYHINRYFIQSPNTTLYVGIFSESVGSGYAFPEVTTMANASGNSIRQLGVYFTTAFVSMSQTKGYITSLQAQIASLIYNKQPIFSIILGTDLSSTTSAALTTLLGLNSEHVSISAGQDGAAEGFAIFSAQGVSVTQLGELLGMVSNSQVSDSIAWVGQYTMSPDGVENEVPAMATGELLSGLTTGIINTVDSFGYIFGRQFPAGPQGTYVNNPYTCTAATSDYFFIQNCRTIDKASRLLVSAYTEELASPLVVNANGTLTNAAIAFFEGVGEDALQSMVQNNPNTGRPELSGLAVTINPAQNVLSTSTLVVAVSLLPIGVANNIIINLQFVVSLS